CEPSTHGLFSTLMAGSVYQGDLFHELAERMAEYPALKVRMFLDIQRKPGRHFITGRAGSEFCPSIPIRRVAIGKVCPEIFYDPRALWADRSKRAALHAKCIVADGRDVFVSSANFTEAAQERNVEVGLPLDSTTVAQRLTGFFEALCESEQFLRAL
ncbi:MAG: phospholipase D-like domain-containing protein, partial [Terracidiphilus sp.]